MMYVLSVMVLVYLLGPYVTSENSPVVETSSGPVQGEIVKFIYLTYAAFRGIRYAEPPTGGLRFKPPVPVRPWDEILNTTVEGDVCPQYDQQRRVIGSEDCLFLNVFTPEIFLSEPPIELKPVMVWIHGGYFVNGSGSTMFKRPDFLLEKGVVFVSFNYRLGVLGFLNMDESHATGNQGLKDQNLALRWVRENIDKFGGDPECVTIFGENAGAASVGFHILSNSSAGLFHRAISMSGTPLSPWAFQSRADAVRQGTSLATLLSRTSPCLGNQEDSIDVLWAATPKQLLKYTSQVVGEVRFTPTRENSEITTDGFLVECSLSKYTSGNVNKVPQILGSIGRQTFPYRYRKEGIFEDFKNFDSFDYVADYVPLDFFKKATGWLKRKVEKVTSEVAFVDPVDEILDLLIANNNDNPIFNYMLTSIDTSPRSFAQGSNPNAVKDANELALLFFIPSNNYDLSPRSPMRRLINTVCTLWTNFAKYGDPSKTENGSSEVFWLSSDKFDQVLEIGYKLELVSRPKLLFGQFTGTGNKTFLADFADC